MSRKTITFPSYAGESTVAEYEVKQKQDLSIVLIFQIYDRKKNPGPGAANINEIDTTKVLVNMIINSELKDVNPDLIRIYCVMNNYYLPRIIQDVDFKLAEGSQSEFVVMKYPEDVSVQTDKELDELFELGESPPI